MATGVPCAYTRTIGFECTRANYQAMQAQYAQGRSRKMDYALIALGGVAGIAIVAGAQLCTAAQAHTHGLCEAGKALLMHPHTAA